MSLCEINTYNMPLQSYSKEDNVPTHMSLHPLLLGTHFEFHHCWDIYIKKKAIAKKLLCEKPSLVPVL